MSIDITQQALTALADETTTPTRTPAEAYILGYHKGWDEALALAIRIEQALDTTTPTFSDTQGGV